MIPSTVKALQDEVERLLAHVEALEAKCMRQEGLLRAALRFVPYARHDEVIVDKKSKAATLVDLGDQIEAELATSVEES